MQRSTLAVFLNLSPSYFLRESLSLNLELNDLVKLAEQGAPGIFLTSPPEIWDYRCAPRFVCGC